MRNKKKLRNIRGEKIYINNDQTKQERDIDKQIRKRAEEEKKQGKSVKSRYQKLIIDDKEWKWNKLKGRLEEVEENDSKN